MKKKMPLKKIGDNYYTLRLTVSRKSDAEKEKILLHLRGRVRIEKRGKEYHLWFAPQDIEWQGLAKQEWQRRRLKGK